MADFTLRPDGLKWHYEVPTDTGIVRGWRPTSRWARRAARRHVRPPTVPCPNCGEGIDRMARRCQFCGNAVPEVGSPQPVDPPAATTTGAAREAARTSTADLPAPPTATADPPSAPTGAAPTPPRKPPPKATKPPAADGEPLSRLTRIGLVVGVAAAAIAVVGIVIYAVNHADSKPRQAQNHPTTTGDVLPSAKGKPCVPVADPLPADAVTVPDESGPAPTERQVEDVKAGGGETVVAADTVTINYVVVACSTGKVVGSSYAAGSALTVPVGSLETVGDNVVGMKVGGERVIGVPSDELTTPVAGPDIIAPDDAVWYVVQVTAVDR